MDAPQPPSPEGGMIILRNVLSLLEIFLQQETAANAYEKWLARGRPADSALRDWLEAEAEPTLLRRLVSQLGQLIAAATPVQRSPAATPCLTSMLQCIVDNTTDAVYVKDLKGCYCLINPAGAAYLGKSVAEVLGKDDTQLFSPQVARQLQEHDRRILSSGQVQTVEDVTEIAGVQRIFLSTKGPLRDPQGNLLGLVGISRDITDRKIDEYCLRAEHATTRILATARTLEAAALPLLRSIGLHLEQDVGFFWKRDPQSNLLHCLWTWARLETAEHPLVRITQELTYGRGYGLPGQVWEQGEDLCCQDLLGDRRLLYRGLIAHEVGLRSAVAFPVYRGEEFFGVFEFFAHRGKGLVPAIRETLRHIALQIGQFLEHKRLEQALYTRQREFALAREIQQSLLPPAPPSWPGWDIAGSFFPAQETGGDYYDFLLLADGSLGVVLGDASGHGIGAALLIAATRAYLRALALTSADLCQMLHLLNRRLGEDMIEGHFVTLLLTRLLPGGYVLSYASAGHWPGYVFDRQGEVRALLSSTGPVLGVDLATTFSLGSELFLQPGEVLLLTTDGLAEALNPQGEMFGKERLLAVARRQLHRSAQQLVQAVCQAAQDFAAGAPADDITAVALKFLG